MKMTRALALLLMAAAPASAKLRGPGGSGRAALPLPLHNGALAPGLSLPHAHAIAGLPYSSVEAGRLPGIAASLGLSGTAPSAVALTTPRAAQPAASIEPRAQTREPQSAESSSAESAVRFDGAALVERGFWSGLAFGLFSPREAARERRKRREGLEARMNAALRRARPAVDGIYEAQRRLEGYQRSSRDLASYRGGGIGFSDWTGALRVDESFARLSEDAAAFLVAMSVVEEREQRWTVAADFSRRLPELLAEIEAKAPRAPRYDEAREFVEMTRQNYAALKKRLIALDFNDPAQARALARLAHIAGYEAPRRAWRDAFLAGDSAETEARRDEALNGPWGGWPARLKFLADMRRLAPRGLESARPFGWDGSVDRSLRDIPATEAALTTLSWALPPKAESALAEPPDYEAAGQRIVLAGRFPWRDAEKPDDLLRKLVEGAYAPLRARAAAAFQTGEHRLALALARLILHGGAGWLAVDKLVELFQKGAHGYSSDKTSAWALASELAVTARDIVSRIMNLAELEGRQELEAELELPRLRRRVKVSVEEVDLLDAHFERWGARVERSQGAFGEEMEISFPHEKRDLILRELAKRGAEVRTIAEALREDW